MATWRRRHSSRRQRLSTWVGCATPEVLRALNVALFDARPRVRSGAAMGLSLLRGPGSATRLLRELEQADTTDEIARLTEPLGYLVAPARARQLVDYVLEKKNGVCARASMIVTLGTMADPEHRPSLGYLGQNANYPATAPSLMACILTR